MPMDMTGQALGYFIFSYHDHVTMGMCPYVGTFKQSL